MAVEAGGGNTPLKAFVHVDRKEKLLVNELHESLRKRLPSYMLPSEYVLLLEMPLLANGKVDRRAVAVMAAAGQRITREYRAPETAAEMRVAGIFEETLGCSRVGLDDNFFELGGHSLLATQALARIREEFRMEIPLHDLFEDPTIAGVVRSLGRSEGEEIIDEPPLAPVLRQRYKAPQVVGGFYKGEI
jgi:acyl carrier protein